MSQEKLRKPSHPLYFSSYKATEWLDKATYEIASLFCKHKYTFVIRGRKCSSFYPVRCSVAVFTFYFLKSLIFVSLSKCMEENLIDH